MTRTRLTRPESAARTRRDLLEAAEQRFLRDGYHATKLDDVAKDAGYTKGAVYSAYKSKAGLFLALFDSVMQRRYDELRALFDEHSPGPELLAALASRPADDGSARFLMLEIEFLNHAARDPELLAEFARHNRHRRSTLAQLAPRDTPLGAEPWAIVTLALANGLALERLVDPDSVPEDLMAAVQYRIARPDPT